MGGGRARDGVRRRLLLAGGRGPRPRHPRRHTAGVGQHPASSPHCGRSPRRGGDAMSPGPLPVGAPPAAAPHPAESAKPKPEIARAAREFEAIFIRKMLTSLEKASHVGKTGALSAGGDVYGSMMVGAVADAVAGAGGIGLASYVTKSLTPTPATAHPLHPTALHPTAHEAVPL